MLPIDCERIHVRQQISRRQRLRLLAKLNRAGAEISLADRLRFMRAYLAIDPLFPTLTDGARAVQKRTAALLRADVERGRQTSIYTQKNYVRIRKKDWAGFLHTTIDLQQTITDLAAGREPAPLQSIRMPANTAQRAWATINVLATAGLRAPLPAGFLVHDRNGWLLWHAADRARMARELTDGSTHMRSIAHSLPRAVSLAQQLCRQP